MILEQQVTVKTLWCELKEKELFYGSVTSLRRLLGELDFKWLKDNPRRGLMELSNISLKRVQFLRQYKQLKNEALYQFVFLDETWIFENGTLNRSWQNENVKSVRTMKVDGKRLLNRAEKYSLINFPTLLLDSLSCMLEMSKVLLMVLRQYIAQKQN